MMDAQARLLAGVPAGVVATLTMDGAMVAAARIGGSVYVGAHRPCRNRALGRWRCCAADGATSTPAAKTRGRWMSRSG